MKYQDLFDQNGNCPNLGDPYRTGESDPIEQQQTQALLFDEEGYLRDRQALIELVRTLPDISPFSDLIAMIHADKFACNTKRHYPTIYYWR